MTFESALDWLYSTQQFGIKLGLENTHRLLDGMGHPEHGLKCLHVAGTNGKGSVCAMLDALLRKAGYRTGLYTSPHLVDFRERIRIVGEKVSCEAVADGLSRLHEIVKGWKHAPTFFELSTVLALDVFSRERCEYVVLETGMGGRLDSTNTVTPLVSVITPISLDHTQWLGETIAAVAGEKAGIIKPGIPVVSAEQTPEAREVIAEAARDAESRIAFVNTLYEGTLGLAGQHQKQNAALALETLETADIAIDPGLAATALQEVTWPGRFQQIGDRFVLDGAHNPHAARMLAQTWRETFGDEMPVVILGVLADKDDLGILEALQPIAAEFVFVPVNNTRSLAPEVLATHANGRCFPSLRAALAENFPGRVLVCGSLFLVGEALEILGGSPA